MKIKMLNSGSKLSVFKKMKTNDKFLGMSPDSTEGAGDFPFFKRIINKCYKQNISSNSGK